jgi:hypothetical protein
MLDRVANKFTIDDGCWEWVAAKNRDGYGLVAVQSNTASGHTTLQAHRVVYELFVGPIPDGMQIDHLCRNPGCVRPDHLEPVTHKENMARAVWPNRWKTHCHRGHAFDETNTYWRKDRPGMRGCKTCNNLTRRISRRKTYGVDK